jgi:transposase InsO family protein
MDRAAIAGGVSMGQRAAFLVARRDRIFGSDFRKQVEELGIEEVLGAPGAPQQRAYIERVIGTIRRECLDHLIVFNEVTLCRHLGLFLEYYHETGTHYRWRRIRRRAGRYSRPSPDAS